MHPIHDDRRSVAAVNPARLPPRVRALVKLLGVDAALALLEARGGVPLYIPKSIETARSYRWANALGSDALKALCEEFGGLSVELPKADSILRQMRNAAILRDATRGVSTTTLAQEHRLCRRQVINILRAADSEGAAAARDQVAHGELPRG